MNTDANDKKEDPGDDNRGKEWAPLVREVLQSFLLMRDLLGYVLPGALLLFLVGRVFGFAALEPLNLLDVT